MDYRTFEQRLLEVLFTTQYPITPAHMAYYARLTVAEAEKHLEQAVATGFLIKDCDLETGAVTYTYPARQNLGPPSPAPLVPVAPLGVYARPLYSPGAAAALSVVLPGAGHMYSDRVASGVRWMIVTILGYMCFFLPGLILHLLCIASAARVPRVWESVRPLGYRPAS
jgi:hypothetical protein